MQPVLERGSRAIYETCPKNFGRKGEGAVFGGRLSRLFLVNDMTAQVGQRFSQANLS